MVYSLAGSPGTSSSAMNTKQVPSLSLAFNNLISYQHLLKTPNYIPIFFTCEYIRLCTLYLPQIDCIGLLEVPHH